MDPVRNPYSPGAGKTPPALAGRDRELDKFDIAVRRLTLGRSARSQLLTGLRGTGKTVLLREFGRIAGHHNWVHENIEATANLAFVESISSLVRKALLRLRTWDRIRERAKRALGALTAFRVRYQLPETGIDVALGVEPAVGRADTGVLDEDLADLFIEIGEAARSGDIGVLLTIDELQHVSQKNLAALIVGLHRVSQEQLPLMVAGAGLPTLLGLVGEAKSYAERLFDFHKINSLPFDDARLALSRPSETEGVAWSDAALDSVFELTRGYPYFLQEFGKHAWDVAVGPDIHRADVDVAAPIALSELDAGFFQVRFDRTTDAERAYLRAMAALGSGPCGSGEVAKTLAKTTAQVGSVRDSLIKRGLIYSPRRGWLAFTVPMFDEYVARVSTEQW